MCTSHSRNIAQIGNEEWKDESISFKRKYNRLTFEMSGKVHADYYYYGPGGRSPLCHPVDLMSKIIGTCIASEIRLVASKWDANFLEPSRLSNTLHI